MDRGAFSPGKGRIERCFGTLQDRLVKALRLAGVNTLEDANRYLEEVFLPEWNQRFARPAAHTSDAHRPIGAQLDLASVLAVVETRRPDNDYTVPWKGRKWQIPKAAIGTRLRRSAIRIEEYLDGRMMAQINGQPVQLALCEEGTAPQAQSGKRPGKRLAPPAGQSHWMDGFHVRTKRLARRTQLRACAEAPTAIVSVTGRRICDPTSSTDAGGTPAP